MPEDGPGELLGQRKAFWWMVNCSVMSVCFYSIDVCIPHNGNTPMTIPCIEVVRKMYTLQIICGAYSIFLPHTLILLETLKRTVQDLFNP